jgi:hypothetical protein
MTTTIRRTEGKRRRYEVVVEGQEPLYLPSVTSILSDVVAKEGLPRWAVKETLKSMQDLLLELPVASIKDANEQEHRIIQLPVEELDGFLATARKAPDAVRNVAGTFGSMAHDLINAILRGQEPVIPVRYSKTIESFYEWKEEHDLSLAKTEIMVYSLTHGYAGTFDCLGWNDNEVVVIDWKTGGIYPDSALQVAAYAIAWEEMTGERVTSGWVVRFGKDHSDFETRRVDLNNSKGAWLDALNFWKGLKTLWMP